MRKTAIIFLISLYTCSQLGSVAWQYYRPLIRTIFSVRQRYRTAKNDPSDLIFIKVDNATFQRIRIAGKEVRLNGVLHDIEKQARHNNEVHLLLRKDEGETWWLSLQQAFEQWIKKSGNPHALPVWHWLMKIYSAPVNHKGLIPPSGALTRHLDVLNTFLPHAPFIPGTGQPPDA